MKHTARTIFTGLALPGLMLPLVASCRHHGEPAEAPPARVSVEVLGRDIPGVSGRMYSGTVESGQTTTVSFSVPGTITKVLAGVGQRVSKGQLLATVRSETLVNNSNIAQAELAEARDAYNRLKKLHDANALPDIRWVEVQQKLRQAENAAAIARRGVGDASIYAPISGYVSEKLAEAGQTVLAAQPVLTIVDLGDMQAVISVPEEDIAAFGPGCTASVVFNGLDSLRVSGTFVRKDVVADPFTRSYSVKFAIPDAGGRVLPGMIATVSVSGSRKGGASPGAGGFTLPSQAVMLDADNRQFVWTVSDGRAERRFVTARELSAGGVLVESGLQRGDTVITAGMQKVGTGTRVATK